MALFPIFPIRLLMIVLPFVIAGGVLGYVCTRGVNSFKKQGVAWGLTALMIIAAVGIGYGKALASNISEPVPEPGLVQGPGTAPNAAAAGYFVRDDAGVLSDDTTAELIKRDAILYEGYGVVIGVVTCNYGRDDLYNYAMDCAEEMNLSGYDFIVALDISGDNYWLIQGADLVDDFTDDDCADFAYDCMERYFAAGDYDSAVLKLTKALEDWYSDYFN